MVEEKTVTTRALSVLSPRDWNDLRIWHDEHGRHDLPWRVNSTPWKILLAEVLLHRTRAAAVEKLYGEALKKFPGPEAVVLKQADWLQTIRSVGLAWRAQSFISTCDSLVALHRSNVPSGWNELTSLPGIGHYIASSVRCFGFGLRQVLVDANTVRLASRITGESLNYSHHRSRKTRQIVSSILEEGRVARARDNYALLDLAFLICRPRKPLCNRCPLVSRCVTGSRSSSDMAPTG